MEVEHVKAQRRKKDKGEMQFEKFVTDGNNKQDGSAKAGAMLNEGFMVETRSKASSPAGARRGVCGLAVRSELSLFGRRVERLS